MSQAQTLRRIAETLSGLSKVVSQFAAFPGMNAEAAALARTVADGLDRQAGEIGALSPAAETEAAPARPPMSAQGQMAWDLTELRDVLDVLARRIQLLILAAGGLGASLVDHPADALLLGLREARDEVKGAQGSVGRIAHLNISGPAVP